MTTGNSTVGALTLRYTAGITLAHLLAVIEVLLIMTALRNETVGEHRPPFTDENNGLIVAVSVLAVLVVAAGSALIVLPSLRWFTAHGTPTPAQRHAALAVTRRTNILVAGTWFLSGAVVVLANTHDLVTVTVLVGPAVFFGATAAVCTAMLLTLHTLQPLSAAAEPYEVDRDTAPGVLARLLIMWVLCCALPSVGIALLVLIRSQGWIIEETASLEIPVLVLCAVAVFWGLRGMVLVSKSISDPLREVIDALADVEHGNMRRRVSVYERSEIGLLQRGFNKMVAGLRERDRLRDLFGRQVGNDVVQMLVDRDQSLYRDVRDVAVLFVDLTGSTEYAATRTPQEVAALLNTFFEIVVAVVDDGEGFINKFQGDAALVVYGAPVASADPATDALATARELAVRMRCLPEMDFGIGVSHGQVFAGFVGGMQRFEYTVLGDPVNEAARLADRAKTVPGRVLCSQPARTEADTVERGRWRPAGTETLRGRATPTVMFTPAP